jgi:membrane fusion protein (multidrug efflux system)
MADKERYQGKLRVILPAIVLGIGAIIGLYYGIDYWLYSMKHVVTDDARIKGRMVSVAPEVSGVVQVLHVEEGQKVQVGQPLLKLSDSSYQLRLQESQAQAEMIERRLEEAKRTYDLHVQRAESQIEHAKAEVKVQESSLAEERTALSLEKEKVSNQIDEAEAALNQAESEVQERQGQVRIAETNQERAQALFKDGIVSVENRDQTQELLVQAQARLRAAQEHVAQLRARWKNVLASRKRIQLLARKIQTGEAEVAKARADLRLAQSKQDEALLLQERTRILEAQLKEAHAKVKGAQNDLNDTVLRSPIAGVVSRQRVEEGQLIQRGQPVLVLSDPQDVWVLANIKESYIRDVAQGRTVDIRVDAYPDRRFEGKVDVIGSAAISEFSLFPPTGTFTKVEQRIPVQISVPNTDGLLKPGMMVVVGIVRKDE